MKFLGMLYNSFLWAMLVSLICFKSEWLEMRVNVGWILFGLWLVFTIAAAWFLRRGKRKLSPVFTLANLVVCLAAAIFLYGPRRLAVVPAAIIREGLHMTQIPFLFVNLVILLCLAAGLVLLFVRQTTNSFKVR